ncbi:MAG TPA: glycerophosphodiester phosphodiesterase [Solirubrobacteraceae bacterium]|nr:glycerophosphodiester phosphodiesterase [Solirubrobacteraceae bacterium]
MHDPLGDEAIAALRPPRLEAVLARYGASTRYLVDLKDPVPAWEGRVVGLLDRHGLGRRAMVQSFDLEALERLHRAAPWLAIAALYRRADSVGLEVRAIPRFARAVGVHHPNVDAAFVAAAHARRLAVHPWTVDDAAEAERLVALGVEGVITNVPDVVRPAVSAAKEHLGHREVRARVDVEHPVRRRVGVQHDGAETVEREREGLVAVGRLEAA